MLDDDVGVDDRLRGEAWDRRRADVVDAQRGGADGRPDEGVQLFEPGWPGLVVGNDADLGRRAHLERLPPARASCPSPQVLEVRTSTPSSSKSTTS